jgi:hypothetical protein
MKLNHKLGVAATLLVASGLLLAGCQKSTLTSTNGETENTVQTADSGEADPQADWVVFSQPQHKFSLKHPIDWLYIPRVDRADLFTGDLEKRDPSQADFIDEITGEPFTVVYTIHIRVEENEENLSARESELSRYIPQGRADIDKKLIDVEIAGVPGVEIKSDVTQVNTSGPVTEYLLAPGNGKLYRFWYIASAHPETHQQYLAEFKDMLATLEFSK